MSLKLKIFLLALLVIAGFVVVRIGSLLQNKLLGTSNSTPLVSSLPQTNPVLTKDTDHDGLPDREEIMYGTNPFNPDTDGDGYLDGEEITTKHDPLNPGSTNKTAPSSYLPDKPNLTVRMANLTVASMISDNGTLMAEYASPQKIDDIVLSLRQAAAAALFTDPPKDSEIKVGADNSPRAVERYLSQITPIVEEIILSPVKLGDATLNTDPTTYFASYQKLYDSLLLLEVPPSWKDLHKQTLFMFKQIANDGQFLTKESINDDPVKAIITIQHFRDTVAQFKSLLAEAASLAQSQNVSTKDTLFELLKT